MTQKTVNHNGEFPHSSNITYYSLLGLNPGASVIDIRRAYRELSKIYHPDTTELPANIATVQFQQINTAYATLSNPERRLNYDLKIGYSRFKINVFGCKRSLLVLWRNICIIYFGVDHYWLYAISDRHSYSTWRDNWLNTISHH